MRINLPQKVSNIIDSLTKAGYEAYAVGGCVRDTILGKEPMDWDITTSAKPEETKKIFSKTIDTGILHGTVTVLMGQEGFEVTTYRIDGTYEDSRHPKEVIFTPSLREDLKRRDFTINAMAYNDTTGLVDEFNGIDDINKQIIRCVGDPEERFTEDALRMMRAVRFAAQLGFSIEEKTWEAIGVLSQDLRKISVERVQVELVKLLLSDYPQNLRSLYETGITKAVLPEFDRMMETTQNNPHHCYTVGEHVIKSLTQIKKDKVLRLTMLLHDVAKPVCKTVGIDGTDHFNGHPHTGSKMAEDILKRLKFDNDTIERVSRLIVAHDDNPPLTERDIRCAVVRCGIEQYPDLFAVKRADILAQSEYNRSEKLSYVDGYEAWYQKILAQNQCLAIKDLAVSGRDLIACGIQPGPKLGETLRDLLEIVLEEPEKNAKDTLLTIINEMK